MPIRALMVVLLTLFLAAIYPLPPKLLMAESEADKSLTKSRQVPDSKLGPGPAGNVKPAAKGASDNKSIKSITQKLSEHVAVTVQIQLVLVNDKKLISAEINNRPLNEILGILADNGLFDIKGNIPSGEPVTAIFSDLALHEALNKLLRGYNYVIVNQSPGQKPLLMIMGKAERGKAADAVAVAIPAPPASQTPDPKSYYVPSATIEPTPVGQNRPQSVIPSANQPSTGSQPLNLPASDRPGFGLRQTGPSGKRPEDHR